MVFVVGSNSGRTNRYNADGGKDQWPIGSLIVMEKNQSWTNRVVGETEELCFARKINPRTLQRADSGGMLTHPRHVRKALRRYLGHPWHSRQPVIPLPENARGSTAVQLSARAAQNVPITAAGWTARCCHETIRFSF